MATGAEMFQIRRCFAGGWEGISCYHASSLLSRIQKEKHISVCRHYLVLFLHCLYIALILQNRKMERGAPTARALQVQRCPTEALAVLSRVNAQSSHSKNTAYALSELTFLVTLCVFVTWQRKGDEVSETVLNLLTFFKNMNLLLVWKKWRVQQGKGEQSSTW